MSEPLKIHLGAGDHVLHGFINVDERDLPGIYKWDLRRGLPPICYEQPVQMYTSSHFLEHLELPNVEKLLLECHKTLIKGGRFRVSVPHFRNMVKAYLEGNVAYFDNPANWQFSPNKKLMEIINYGLYQMGEHKIMYDADYLCFLLKKAGFSQAYETSFNPDFDPDIELRRKYSLYCEAVV